jgi:hypothetical protein
MITGRARVRKATHSAAPPARPRCSPTLASLPGSACAAACAIASAASRAEATKLISTSLNGFLCADDRTAFLGRQHAASRLRCDLLDEIAHRLSARKRRDAETRAAHGQPEPHEWLVGRRSLFAESLALVLDDEDERDNTQEVLALEAACDANNVTDELALHHIRRPDSAVAFLGVTVAAALLSA